MQAELENLRPKAVLAKAPTFAEAAASLAEVAHQETAKKPVTKPGAASAKMISFQKHEGSQPSSAGAPWFTAGVKKTASPQKVEMPPKPAKLSKEAVQSMLC